MRKNGYSAALREFEQSLERARLLRKLDIKLYADPPPQDDQMAVEALRGGAAILMVASLERYLKTALEEYVDLVAAKAKLTSHHQLPAALVEYNDLNFVSWLVRDSRLPKKQKIMEIQRVAAQIAGSKFIPESFSRTRANPGSQTVKDLLNEFGVSDPFGVIEVNFARHYQKPFGKGFVSTTLDSIVKRRNEVAHGGYALGISRKDLGDGIEFLKGFGRATDNTLRDYTRNLIASL